MGKRIKFNKVIKLKRENVTPKQSIRAYGLHFQRYMLRTYVLNIIYNINKYNILKYLYKYNILKYLYIKIICLCKFMT